MKKLTVSFTLEELQELLELVDNQLKFRRRVVDEQAAFVRKLMKAMRPALAKLEAKPAQMPEPTAKTAAKRHAVQRSPGRRAPVHRAA